MKILRSFKFALKGTAYTLKNERNMRIHTIASVGVLSLSPFFELNTEKYLILLLTMALVIVSEMINSSVECLVDVYSKNYNSTAKIAKDIAAGAVFVASGFAVIVGVLLFHDINAYARMWSFLCRNPFSFLFVATFMFFGYFYVSWGPAEIKNKVKKTWNSIK